MNCLGRGVSQAERRKKPLATVLFMFDEQNCFFLRKGNVEDDDHDNDKIMMMMMMMMITSNIQYQTKGFQDR